MSSSVVRRGQDTYVRENLPNAKRGAVRHLVIDNTAAAVKQVFVYFPLPSLAGRTVVTATLTGRVKGAAAAQTYNAQRLAEGFDAESETWTTRPSATGSIASVSPGALPDGGSFTIPLTAILQAVANGAKWYGLRVTTSASAAQKLYGFRSGVDSWVLSYELSEVPEKPSLLSPDGARVVSRAKPVLSWDFTDFDGTTEQAAFQVQIDPLGAGGGAADFDTGELASTEPEYDTSTGTYPGFTTAGGTTQWRVRVKDPDNNWSDWSDWAVWTYRADPSLIMDSPAGATISDTSPTILAHISTALLAAWQIRVADGDNPTRIRYDSGRQPASHSSNIAHTIPFEDDGKVVFNGQPSYWLNVRAWDSYNRVATPGDPAYVETWVQITLSAAGVAAVLNTVEQPDDLPRVRLNWSRAAAPDFWLIERDGIPYARLEPGDVTAGGGNYTWTDPSYTALQLTHTWRVRAITAGVQSLVSNEVSHTIDATGTWLINDAGDFAILRGGSDDVPTWQRLDRSVVYKTLDGSTIVIIDGQEGWSGGFTGELHNETEATRAEAIAVLDAMKAKPATPVWIVTRELAFRAIIRNLSYPPAVDRGYAIRKASRVSFSFDEVRSS